VLLLQTPPSCNTTFIDAMNGDSDLLSLTEIINIANFAKDLPSPDLGLTIFAPNNNAFFKFLIQGNIGFDSLSSLGSIFPSLFLYQVVLGSYSTDQLATTPSLNTVLGLATNQNLPLNFSVNPDLNNGPVSGLPTRAV
jgi:Fasciclin domain